VIDALNDLPNVVFELGNEVDIPEGMGAARSTGSCGKLKAMVRSSSLPRGCGRSMYGDYIYPDASWEGTSLSAPDF
jgi:hypothetical protein